MLSRTSDPRVISFFAAPGLLSSPACRAALAGLLGREILISQLKTFVAQGTGGPTRRAYAPSLRGGNSVRRGILPVCKAVPLYVQYFHTVRQFQYSPFLPVRWLSFSFITPCYVQSSVPYAPCNLPRLDFPQTERRVKRTIHSALTY